MEERIAWLRTVLAPRMFGGEVILSQRPLQTVEVEFVAALFADAIDAAMQNPQNAYDIMKAADGGTRGYAEVLDACHEAGTL